jgi:hypothetical protein
MNMIAQYHCREWILRNRCLATQLNIIVQYFIWLLRQENKLSGTDAAFVACVWKSRRIAARSKSGTMEDHNACTKITRQTCCWASQTSIKRFWCSMAHHLMGFSRFLPPTIAKEILTWEKQSFSARFYPLRYTIWPLEIILKTWNSEVAYQSTGIMVLETSVYSVVNEYYAVLPTD